MQIDNTDKEQFIDLEVSTEDELVTLVVDVSGHETVRLTSDESDLRTLADYLIWAANSLRDLKKVG